MRRVNESFAQRLDGDDSLAAGGQHFVDRKVRCDLAGAAEAGEAGGGEDGAVVEAGAQLVDARVDVAADVVDAQIRIERAKLGAAAGSARADHGAVRQRRDRRSLDVDPGVARIGALEKTGQNELVAGMIDGTSLRL